MNTLDAASQIDAWRAEGDAAVDPVRFRMIEAMARRASAHEGAVRTLLDSRLAERMAAYRETLASRGVVRTHAGPRSGAPSRGALAELVDQLEARAPVGADETLGYLRKVWARLSAEKRISQSEATVPGNAGPLNSHHLAQRALTVMRDTSPGYLSHFMAYVDTLLWLDQANNDHALAGAVADPKAGADKASAPAKTVKRRAKPAPR